MRESFRQALLSAARENEKILVLSGDHGYALFDDFRAEFPGRFINAGISEQNMIGVAAGLAKTGFVPIVYGLASFIPVRVLEQIKIDLLLENLHVILIGDGAGFVYSSLGASHQSGEDVSTLRALPHIRIASPSDPLEMSGSLALALETKGTTYIRMGKSDLGRVHDPNAQLLTNGLIPILTPEGPNGRLTFVSTGSMVVLTRELIQKYFPGSALYSAPLLKPFDQTGLLAATPPGNIVITVEEHYAQGGLGSIVCETLSELQPGRVLRIGAKDDFTSTVGSHAYVLSSLNLNLEMIRDRVKTFITG